MQLPDIPAGLLAGVDEAGRGPLAGPVIAAAVILDPENPVEGLGDSKQLTQKRRESLYDEITGKAIAWATGRAEVTEIDRINILQATLHAMRRAVEQLRPAAAYVLVDGNQCPSVDCPVEAIVKGDSKVAAISAASIIAKVTRDREMIEMDGLYPGYGFAGHKGYPSSRHLEALQRLGVTPIHRCSFAPVRKLLDGG
ncbi:MAG: ribonuclease HII [Gammaproteobacteria bacterium]|nr:MAG: ribonuclease HII [Gammaproteobacteria bacterium]